MSIERNTNFGNINVTNEALAALVGGIVSECYGVVGMASQKLLKDGLAELLGQENYARGVEVTKTDNSLQIDLYIIISYGIRVSQVVSELQKKVKYELEKSLDLDITSVNVYVQGVKVVE
jgi:uncharacterized alkaline shock family protein YloU